MKLSNKARMNNSSKIKQKTNRLLPNKMNQPLWSKEAKIY